MTATHENGNIVVTFSSDEALVIQEWLGRFNEKQHPELFLDQAEERLLFDLEAELEKNVSDTFASNYKEILEKAWAQLRDKE